MVKFSSYVPVFSSVLHFPFTEETFRNEKNIEASALVCVILAAALILHNCVNTAKKTCNDFQGYGKTLLKNVFKDPAKQEILEEPI